MEEISKKITGEVKISTKGRQEFQSKIKNVSDFKKEIKTFLEKPITDLLEIILTGAIILGASDIHTEPQEEEVKIRARIDGILQDIIVFDYKTYGGLLSRIKLLSKIKLNITKQPQDGRFTILFPAADNLKEEIIEIRTSTLPTEYGEAIVMRVLNPKNLIEIEGLGLRKDLLEIFKKEIKQPNGMIIVTGPTGSGKTTTLYAFLKRIHQPEIKVITIEDPIEYHLEGISQTQVNPKRGYDFANGLRAIVRQDPDVILVGEIRDLETAQISLQAALTGHLVLSTLHTNDASGTIARLQALGEKSINIAPAINMAIAQRLVRKICQKCLEFQTISSSSLEKIKKELNGISSLVQIPKLDQKLKIPLIKGCDDCNFTGYRGRIGIYEAFLIDEEMEKFILASPSISDLKALAIKKGMILMKQDGLIKVLEGITTLEEVERVTGE